MSQKLSYFENQTGTLKYSESNKRTRTRCIQSIESNQKEFNEKNSQPNKNRTNKTGFNSNQYSELFNNNFIVKYEDDDLKMKKKIIQESIIRIQMKKKKKHRTDMSIDKSQKQNKQFIKQSPEQDQFPKKVKLFYKNVREGNYKEKNTNCDKENKSMKLVDLSNLPKLSHKDKVNKKRTTTQNVQQNGVQAKNKNKKPKRDQVTFPERIKANFFGGTSRLASQRFIANSSFLKHPLKSTTLDRWRKNFRDHLKLSIKEKSGLNLFFQKSIHLR